MRLDTGEMVKEEAMTAVAECQTHMFAAFNDFQDFMRLQEDLYA